MTADKTGWDAMIKRAELRETLADAICASDIRDAEGRILYYRQADAILDALAAAGLLAEDRAGDHEWIDMTTFGDADRHEVCSGCGDTRTSVRP